MVFKAISERMCMLSLRGKCRNLSIINVYAPTEVTEVEVKERFYEQLENENMS